MDVQALLTILAINVVGIYSPGPDVFLIMRLATKSRRHALAAVAGISTAVALWVALTVFGVATLLSTVPEAMGIIQLVGGLWLAYMAYGMARSARAQWGRSVEELGVDDHSALLGSLGHSYRAGLLTNLANPKAVLYFAAIMAPLMPTQAPLWVSVVLVIVIVVEVALCHGLIAVTVSTERIKRRLLGAGAYIDAAAAAIFGLFALALFIKGVSALVGA
ncbi:LysE family translocator [Corynebacterium sp. 320]|uniref:LysE family translocator n=1 Tax=Corynebacterium TaxID=1716 RepID=UPI00125CCC6D|nr:MULTISPECIES: LysE family translocator [Corynebacterium]KAB1502462.1 LysE family translocator [Corynebacterium sp. 320]KAB1551317.1 LysE family translocator [Corynebacterium sp. 321]KAB1551855.1 LysE family translocator [Corynebacterium sp. 319]KAB3526069.1 LysE family translocator [Corynebacterium sp. 250]KAB3538849.1 LysE family translocator [Corynebacterium sp. 366]